MAYADPPLFSSNLLEASGRGVWAGDFDLINMEKPMKPALATPPDSQPAPPSLLETAFEQKVNEEAMFQLDAVDNLRRHLTSYEAGIKQEIRQKTLATMLEAIGVKPPDAQAAPTHHNELKDALRTLLEQLGGFPKV